MYELFYLKYYSTKCKRRKKLKFTGKNKAKNNSVESIVLIVYYKDHISMK